MVDCGRDWRGRVASVGPDALLITHAHPDHAAGLVGGVPCPVFATPAVWAGIRTRGLDRRELPEGVEVEVGGLRIRPMPVEHSLRAPAVGFRVSAGRVTVFYVPDVARIPDPVPALAGVDLYVGDGATLTRRMIRRRDGDIGHATIGDQLGWCRAAGVSRAVFTHLGTVFVAGDEEARAADVVALGRAQGVRATIAHDGLEIHIRPGTQSPPIGRPASSLSSS
jgi:phosphoribosyl 1,2-cyclic phosphodiesterase